MTREDRFWARVEKTEGCWLWTGSKLPAGYGRFGGNGYAHRYAYELLVGPIPSGLHIDHLCRNPSCVNPAHLEPVTPKENTRRGLVGQTLAARTHCPHGHEYTEENTIRRPRAGRIERQCRECKNADARSYQKRKRAERATA